MAFARYQAADLQRLIDEEAGGDFVAAYLSGVVEAIKRQPEHYRGFGPYWWPLKALLIDAGHADFGTEIEDTDAHDQLTYSTPTLTAAAAYTFSEHAFNDGMQAAAGHSVEYDDGEVETYFVADEEMEQLIVAREYMTFASAGGEHGEA